MLVLRADPWDPEFGMGYEATAIDATPPGVDPSVERADWTLPIDPQPGSDLGSIRFVDGVRRVELRLLADDGGRRASGLFGSFAVGCVERDGSVAAFGDYEVGRAVVLGGGLQPERASVVVGGSVLTYEPMSVPGIEPDRPLWGLQKRMREAEGALAARVAAQSDVVLVDGPLTFTDPSVGAVVGIVKRTMQAYLDPAHEALLARLAPGQRTPLFGVGTGQQPIDRYAWYTRLVPRRPEWHDHAGVVRCEVREGLGLDAAITLADRVTLFLPDVAGRPSDPRAPQNLAPVGALEHRLKHRLGHAGLIRRALTSALSSGILGSEAADEAPIDPPDQQGAA